MAMTEKELKYNKFMIKRQKAIRKARTCFWTYCKLESPAFFTESRWHLHLMAWVLQALYEHRLTKDSFIKAIAEIAPVWFVQTDDYKEMTERLKPDYIYNRLMMNEPPRTGKSRTLVNFTKWVLGRDQENRIITASYNDTMAQEFSRFCRDGIMQQKNYPHEVIYNDVFPHSVIQEGNASYKKWALEGQFFNYLGAGIGAGITGKGTNCSIIDDPVKDAEEAFNELRLDAIWQWYSGTFLSRNEENGIEIINMTRWAAGDICGRILGDEKNKGPEADDWFILKLVASYEVDNTKHMLCEELLSEQRLERLRKSTLPEVFYANYYQQPVDIQGRMYKTFKTYLDIPRDDNGNPLFERIVAYADTADEGSDYLAVGVAGVYNGELYMLDVYYTKAGMEITEPETATILHINGVGFSMVESNNGGRGFARQVERHLWETHKSRFCVVKWFHQSKNKKARIITGSAYVQQHMYFPVNWADKWPDYYQAMTTYQKEGKNKNDDAPDMTTGLAEMLQKTGFGLGAVTVNI